MTAAPPVSSDPPSNEPTFPRVGALLGVDFGARRIGIAVCNTEQTIAVPLETYASRTPELDRKHWMELIGDYRIRGIVVGLPLMNRTGDEGRQAAITREFGERLRTASGLPVTYWDERYSSAAAETLLWSRGESPRAKNGRLDGLAAQIILQTYLDQRSAK